MISTIVFGIGLFVFGVFLGYSLCRHFLWHIAKDVGISDYHHAKLFGYVYRVPTIAELEEILKKEQ